MLSVVDLRLHRADGRGAQALLKELGISTDAAAEGAVRGRAVRVRHGAALTRARVRAQKERGPMTDERAATKIQVRSAAAAAAAAIPQPHPCLQSSFRGYRLRRDLEREYAAIRVQAVWRGYHERCKFDKMIAAMEAELAEDGAPPGM